MNTVESYFYLRCVVYWRPNPYPHAPYKTGENPCVFLGLITARSCRSATVSPYIKGRIMDKSLLPLISKIDSYISRNTETSLVIFLSTDFYQRILHSNRTSFNLTYDPPKLLGHSFSVRDDIDTMEKQFFVTSETALWVESPLLFDAFQPFNVATREAKINQCSHNPLINSGWMHWS